MVRFHRASSLLVVLATAALGLVLVGVLSQRSEDAAVTNSDVTGRDDRAESDSVRRRVGDPETSGEFSVGHAASDVPVPRLARAVPGGRKEADPGPGTKPNGDEVAVRFEVLQPPAEPFGIWVEAESATRAFSIEVDDSRAIEVSLRPGSYRAALFVDSPALHGAIARFQVGSEPRTVVLKGAPRFSLAYQLLDSDDEEVISGAEVVLRRLGGLGGDDQVSVVSDDHGIVRVSGLTSGRYELTESAPGYISATQNLELPGDYAPWLVNGTLDLRQRFILPELGALIKLDGAEGWGGPERFQVAHVFKALLHV